jgi:hypothetical protein
LQVRLLATFKDNPDLLLERENGQWFSVSVLNPHGGLFMAQETNLPVYGEMFTRSIQKPFGPEENKFVVDAATAKEALLTSGFELVTNKPLKRKSSRRQRECWLYSATAICVVTRETCRKPRLSPLRYS